MWMNQKKFLFNKKRYIFCLFMNYELRLSQFEEVVLLLFILWKILINFLKFLKLFHEIAKGFTDFEYLSDILNLNFTPGVENIFLTNSDTKRIKLKIGFSGILALYNTEH